MQITVYSWPQNAFIPWLWALILSKLWLIPVTMQEVKTSKSSLEDCVALIIVCCDLTFELFCHDQLHQLSGDSGHVHVVVRVCVCAFARVCVCVCTLSCFPSCLTSWHPVYSAQMAGLLCEEEGPEADNVKYCGYCKHHYNKMVRWTAV